MQNSPFQSCAHFLEISSHTALWEQMAGHPRPALQIQTKKTKQLSDSSFLRTQLKSVSCQWQMLFSGWRKTNVVQCYLISLFSFTNRNEMHWSSLTGTKDTEENWEGRKGKCQPHCWYMQQKVVECDTDFNKTFCQWFLCQSWVPSSSVQHDNLNTTDYCDNQSIKIKLGTKLFQLCSQENLTV